MASMVDQSGVQVDLPGDRPAEDIASLGKTRSLVIAALKTQGYSLTAIGCIMNLSRQHVSRLYHDIPEDYRRFYGAAASAYR